MGELRNPESASRVVTKKQTRKPNLRETKAGAFLPPQQTFETTLHAAYAIETQQVANEAGRAHAKDAVVIDHAIEVIGNKAAALRWMGTPVRALEYATPISLLHTSKGRKAVLDVLDRLEYGVL